MGNSCSDCFGSRQSSRRRGDGGRTGDGRTGAGAGVPLTVYGAQTDGRRRNTQTGDARRNTQAGDGVTGQAARNLGAGDNTRNTRNTQTGDARRNTQAGDGVTGQAAGNLGTGDNTRNAWNLMQAQRRDTTYPPQQFGHLLETDPVGLQMSLRHGGFEGRTEGQLQARTGGDLLREAAATIPVGSCGETANRLRDLFAGSEQSRRELSRGEGVSGMCTEARQHQDCIIRVTAGREHAFIVEKRGENVTVLQSEIQRYTLPVWMAQGQTRMSFSEFETRITNAFEPNVDSNSRRQAQRTLFEVPGRREFVLNSRGNDVSWRIFERLGNEQIATNIHTLRTAQERAYQAWRPTQ